MYGSVGSWCGTAYSGQEARLDTDGGAKGRKDPEKSVDLCPFEI
jgi:hypothetical protein